VFFLPQEEGLSFEIRLNGTKSMLTLVIYSQIYHVHPNYFVGQEVFNVIHS